MRALNTLVLLAACLATASWANLEGQDDLWWAEKYQRRLKRMIKAESTFADSNLRLPQDVLPISYAIKLIPLIEVGKFTTDGSIEIIVECKKNTPSIVLNAAELTIEQTSITVTEMDTNVSLNVGLIIDEQKTREMITIPVVPLQLQQGKKYKITMRFVSVLNDQLRGLYRSSYVENGVTKYLAVSQFEAPDARRSFPCFDEPNMKATFTITLGHKSTMTPVSNMPKTGPSLPIGFEYPGYFWTQFEPSVKMSTYLVAMMVSDFVSVESDTNLKKVEFKIWARDSFKSQARYAGNIGPRILKYFEYFYQIDYPLPKQDMAAIPDFSAGAMENWGLITYRESDLLFDDQRSSEVAKRRVAEVVAHELAHQWFGNLVTIDWWNVIWLNEGFARYMQYIGTHAVEPSFHMNDQFALVTMQSVFQVDSLESSRPINMEANTAAEISAMFDTISYNKGACILRMLANFLGLETFQYGITKYLNNKAYGNTVQDDLWEALQEQADADKVVLPAKVKAIMDSWTDRMGFPLIRVNRIYDRGNGAVIQQERFLLRKSENSSDQTVYRWWVPLTYTSNFNQEPSSVWMPNDKDSININTPGLPRDQWLIFNVDQVGYYRVHYDNENYELILKQLKTDHRAISVVNRAQLLDDALNIARAGIMHYDMAMEITTYLTAEQDYIPWSAASTALDYIDIMFYSKAGNNFWKTYMSSLVNEIYQHVGFAEGPKDSHLLKYARSVAVNWACTRLGNSNCIQSAKTAYSNWMSNPNATNNNGISPNLLRLITCTAIAEGGRPEWDFAWGKYLASTLVNEKNDLLRALTCSKDEAIIKMMLNLLITPDGGIRLQDFNTFFSNIAANEVGNQLALEWMTNSWDDIMKYLNGYDGFGGSTTGSMFRAICNRVNTDEKLKALIDLRDKHPVELGSSGSVRQGLEVANANMAWLEKNEDAIRNWLRNRVDPTTTTPTSTTSTRPSTTRAPVTSAGSTLYSFNNIGQGSFILFLAAVVFAHWSS